MNIIVHISKSFSISSFITLKIADWSFELIENEDLFDSIDLSFEASPIDDSFGSFDSSDSCFEVSEIDD